MAQSRKYLVVHGHFYQPPRENPWLGRVEMQPSANPDHDWNARILKQCYEPNGCSRLLSPDGRIRGAVNNYEYMSYNFGPTLMNWIQVEEPRTYERIVAADQESVKKLGYGNAIAQVFNHIIMPLANPRDRLTQIRWGIADFKRHFGRRPDSIWLAETAINNETVADLIREGIRYVILAPSQAQSVRPMDGESAWQDVSRSNIDGRRSYRIYPRDGRGRALCDGHLDAFFYHDGLSRAVSFERVLNDANHFTSRVHEAFDNRLEDQIVTIATDGESYGHHHPFGDMCLAYMFQELLPTTEIEVINPAAFLAKHPPTWEVELKNGTGEGTAWSCAHGVGRWYRDCGCETGAREGWNQKWRTPLRNALNLLRDSVDPLFATEVSRLCGTDPWLVRDAYAEVIGDPENPVRIEAFADRFLRNKTPENRTKLLKLLEMQKFMLYAFTSCGWFFNDFEGIEPLQNLKYASRVVDFVTELFPGQSVEQDFMRALREAVSNETKRPGDEIYREHTSQTLPLEARIMASVIFQTGFSTRSFMRTLAKYEVNAGVVRHDPRHILWQVEVFDRSLLERTQHLVLTLRSEFHEDLVVCLPKGTKQSQVKVPDQVFAHRQAVQDFYQGSCVIAVSDLLPDHLMQLLDDKARSSFAALCEEFREFPRRYNLFYDLIAQQEIHVPEWISTPIRLSLNAEVNRLLRELLEQHESGVLEQLLKAVDHAQRLRMPLQVEWIQREYAEVLEALLAEVVRTRDTHHMPLILSLITAADRTGMEIHRTELENLALPLLVDYHKNPKVWARLQPLLAWLNFAV